MPVLKRACDLDELRSDLLVYDFLQPWAPLEAAARGVPAVHFGKQGDWAALMCAICYSVPPELSATASPEFRGFISCCLQKNPAKRLSAAQLLQHPFVAGPQPLPLAAPPS